MYHERQQLNLHDMITTKFGEIILNDQDVFDSIMQGRDIWNTANITVTDSIDVTKLVKHLEDPAQLVSWKSQAPESMSIQEFDQRNQSNWFMPDQYRNMDIAQHVIDLAKDNIELQRLAQELLLYQERDLFNLLRYLCYLVDIMRKHNIVWGVGRGSSVASFVLYKMGVHRIDSLYYDLDPNEFLR